MKRERQNRIHLFLLEAMSLIIVFSLASTLILTVFLKGNQIRVKSDRLNEAILYSQNVIEALRTNEDISQFSSATLEAQIDITPHQQKLGVLNEMSVSIKDRQTGEVVYHIETGIYDYEN